MKTLFLTLSLFTLVAQAQVTERTFTAIVRTEDNKAEVGNVVLKNLIGHDAFEGTYFKVVQGKSEEAVRFDADESTRFRAATVYYHLTKAREYFVNKVRSSYVASIPKMTIRIGLTNQFSELGHFTHDNFEPQYNNALTVPAGKGLASRGVKPWEMEIWFRPSKRVHIRDLKVNDSSQKEFMVLMQGFRDQMRMQSLQRFLSQAIMAFTEDNSANPISVESLIRTVGGSLILEATYLFADPLTKALSRKWYWLDTAMVPEIIYHEYAHAALSDHLILSHSTAIIEGMADFFAGQIANSPKLAMKIKKYNTFNGKNAKRKQDYALQFESTQFANTDFVFGLLWELKNLLGEEKGEAFMFELRKSLTTNSTIRDQLIEAILDTCDRSCTAPFNDKLRILKTLNLRGI